MGSANSSAFLQGADDIDSAVQVCPLQLKTVALYPVRWAISQEETALPANFHPPTVLLENTHYCVRKLTPGWVYMFSEVSGTFHEYRVNEQGVITEVQPGVNSVLLPDVDAESALPCIHHPAQGKVFLKFVHHRWTARLQELARTDAKIREGYMQAFDLQELPEKGEGINIGETEALNALVEDFRSELRDFSWSFTDFAQGINEADLQGQCKKETEFSYCVALQDEIGIASELGQLHALHVNLILNHAEENTYAYTTSQMVDALIAREAGKKETEDKRNEAAGELKKRIRLADKDAFLEGYHKQAQEYDQARSCVFDDWKRWIDSDQMARKLELNDIYCADGFKAVEKELADILDGYVGAEKGKQDAEKWMAAEEGDAGTVGGSLKCVLFLASATNKITQQLKDLPGFDYGSLKVVGRIFDMPAHVQVSLATDTLMLEFAAPAAAMGAWAKNTQTRPHWKKWIKNVSKRYGIEIHEHGIALDTATELLLEANRKSLEAASGHYFSELSMTPLAAGMADVRIRNYLQTTLIEVFHLDPNFKDNPFDWLHTRLDPVVESIKENCGKFIGAVTFFQAFNMVSLFSGLRETHQDVMLGDRSMADKWLPFVDSFWSVAEGIVNLSGLLIRSEYAKALGVDLSATGVRVSEIFRGARAVQALTKGTTIITKVAVKYLPLIGPVLAIILEGKAVRQAWHTGQNAAVLLAAVQIGLTVSIGYLTILALAGAATIVSAPIVLIGAMLLVITVAVSAIQMYIARSRMEDFLSQSFWGEAPTLRYWDNQSRPSNDELLDAGSFITSQDEGVEVRQYFEAELNAFHYILFSPFVRVTEYMSKHAAITRQGEHKILSEFTGFVVCFPGYDQASCTVSIKLFEADRNWFFDDQWDDITDLFERRMDASFSSNEAMYRFTHYNHNNREQLELLIEYVKDGRKITGDEGLRIILDGNGVEELGVDERLTFEL
ncbi:hypothetical protein SAMN05216369_3126 [Marinobacter antarcticus]|uniref:Toxin VasX N-terminal region domain-containing protein n=1 Tax=Marinobacter antarcticus TaxID=564117 RepID=A0A1M6VCT6_9GAMM|nr:toxin VasX [Marinobacter antarcticus]SHK79347.1 hypothetical protein SAMN05216369_3126 [Marinobacter antarcticus]